MTRLDRKALAIAIAGLLVLSASGSASALTMTSLGGGITIPSQLSLDDLNLSGWSYDSGNWNQYTSNASRYLVTVREGGGTYPRPVPEPSAALVFGLGLLAARRFARRAR